MVKVVKSTIIDAPVEAVWEVLRDFNGHDRWHPAVVDSQMERGAPTDKVGGVRRFHLADGSELREQLLTLSDLDMAFTYCLLDTPIPLLNYVAHVRLSPVTDGDMTFWHWESRFDTPPGRETELRDQVAENIYAAGMEAVRAHIAGDDGTGAR
ncbi:SRPBCC family protein [Acuticoccus sp. M5D2P5]|uniref:SRPBCC family protein n=1 Tax=Acuticoccus kalidii TaxID=2910977 RepID=UPI001F40B23B|nr:SRPBCC family protein [Acuticoccus kalidii]MCF3936233.1 SRPBCC family protein [Acuticoccus kalidii]